MILLVLAGVLSMLAQVVILRELVSALFGVELLYVLALGTWLVGTAAGAWAGRRANAPRSAAAAGFLALGVLVPAGLVLVRAAGTIMGAVPGAYLPFPAQLLLIASATLPPAAACGMVFPPLAALGDRQGSGLGRAYALEGAGAAAGGALVTAAMRLGAPTLAVAVTAGALALAAAASAGVGRRRVVIALLGAITAGWAAALWHAGAWDARLTRWTYPALAAAADTPYARIVVTRSHGQAAVFENGALAFESEGTSAEAFADIAAAQHARPLRALVVGGSAEGVAEALAADRVLAVDSLETDERAYRLARAHVSAPPRRAEAAEGARVIFAEPRRYLPRAAPYDLILIATGEPASGAASRFYTREFFRACARGLAPGGVLAVRLAASENVWPRPLARRTASIVNALRSVFPHVEALPGATLYVFASAASLEGDPDVLSRRLAARGVRPRLMTPPYVRYLYENDRRDQVRRDLASLRGVAPNRDAAPASYRYAAAMWLSRFYPALGAASEPDGLPVRWVLLAGVAALGVLAWARRRLQRRLVLLLVGAGFAGMVLEAVLLLQYQMANGTMYRSVGWLLTCFMAGMSAGSWLFGRPGAPGERRASTWTRFGPAGGLFAAAAVTGLSARVPGMAGLAWTSILLAGSGIAVGACFAAAAARWPGGRLHGASSLYAGDVAGGAAGAVLATLVLVPTVGLDGASVATGLLAALLLLL